MGLTREGPLEEEAQSHVTGQGRDTGVPGQSPSYPPQLVGTRVEQGP
jgi:hypothetical protein